MNFSTITTNTKAIKMFHKKSQIRNIKILNLYHHHPFISYSHKLVKVILESNNSDREISTIEPFFRRQTPRLISIKI